MSIPTRSLLLLAAALATAGTNMKEMEDWYCSQADTADTLPCMLMRTRSVKDKGERKEQRKAMKGAMKLAMTAREGERGPMPPQEAMFERWCGEGPGAGTDMCKEWGKRDTPEIGGVTPRSPMHDERVRMLEWYCSESANERNLNCLHKELRRSGELTAEERKECQQLFVAGQVMAKIQEQMRDRGAMKRDTDITTAEWCAPDLPAGEERASADSTLCPRWSERQELDKKRRPPIDELR